MEAGSVVRAVFDFCPSVSEELPLFVGDVIEVLEAVDEFWLLGKKEGVTGQFPSSFVEAVALPSLTQGEKLFVCTNDFTSQEPGSLSLQRGDLVILSGSLTASWLQGRSCWGSKGSFPSSCVRELCLSPWRRRPPPSPVLVPADALGQARALMSLSAQLEEELDFREGDVITIVEIPEPGWFTGELGGRRGIFPEGFVELLGPLRVPGGPEGPGPAEGARVNGVAEGCPEQDGGPCGVALYRFQALEPNELDFDVGDRIRIVGVLEDGWLEGQLRGRRGIFPHRFVRLEAGNLQGEGSRGQATCQDPVEACTGALPLPGEQGGWQPVGERPSTTALRPGGVSDAGFGECKPAPSGGHPPSTGPQGPLPTDSAKAINGISPTAQLPPQPTGRLHCQAVVLEPSQSPGPSQRPLEIPASPEKNGGSPSVSPGAPGSPLHSSQSQTFPSPSSWAAAELGGGRMSILFQDLASWVEEQKQKSTSCSSSCRGAHEGLGPWPEAQADWPSPMLHGDSGADLDCKLTEQLAQFEQSLASVGAESDKRVSRHFSILDYSSEEDIVRGSPEGTPHWRLPERRKALRPPPPRPSAPAVSPSFSVRPSRPAPLPPPSSQRRNTASPQLQPRQGDSDRAAARPCPFLLTRAREVEQELEVYGKTRAELNSLLEEQQDELERSETLENLEFCDSSMRSLIAELQELREMTLLSSRPAALEAAAGTAATEKQRMLEKRSKVIEELLQTERDYIRDLEMCVERIMVPLQQAQVGSRCEVRDQSRVH